MTTDEWNALLNKLTEAWEQFAVTVRQAADALTKIFGQLYEEKEKRAKEKAMFVCAETTNYWMIVYHKKTKVMYAVNKNISNNAGCGVFSPLYNADGTLQIYEGDEIE